MGARVLPFCRSTKIVVEQVLEVPFESHDPAVACVVFDAWQALAQNFARYGQLSNIRRVKLLAKPLYHALLLHPIPAVQQASIRLLLLPAGGSWQSYVTTTACPCCEQACAAFLSITSC